MKVAISPWFLRVAGVLLFGALMAARAEVVGHWSRALLAGGAFGILGFTLRAAPRP